MRNRLAAYLRELLFTAERCADGQTQAMETDRGLRVEVRILDGGKFALNISRLGILPSAEEWVAIITTLPEAYKPHVPVLPRDYRVDGRWFLSCTYPLRKRRDEKKSGSECTTMQTLPGGNGESEREQNPHKTRM